jgi:hypothetical protein
MPLLPGSRSPTVKKPRCRPADGTGTPVREPNTLMPLPERTRSLAGERISSGSLA